MVFFHIVCAVGFILGGVLSHGRALSAGGILAQVCLLAEALLWTGVIGSVLSVFKKDAAK